MPPTSARVSGAAGGRAPEAACVRICPAPRRAVAGTGSGALWRVGCVRDRARVGVRDEAPARLPGERAGARRMPVVQLLSVRSVHALIAVGLWRGVVRAAVRRGQRWWRVLVCCCRSVDSGQGPLLRREAAGLVVVSPAGGWRPTVFGLLSRGRPRIGPDRSPDAGVGGWCRRNFRHTNLLFVVCLSRFSIFPATEIWTPSLPSFWVLASAVGRGIGPMLALRWPRCCEICALPVLLIQIRVLRRFSLGGHEGLHSRERRRSRGKDAVAVLHRSGRIV